MQDLPSDLRVIAIDLRGFGGTEHAPVDATRGVRDFSDDLHATLEALGIPTAHLVGWSMGAGVVMQYALDHPVLSLTLESPVSPYGFGGTRRDGTRLTDDDAGTRRRRSEPRLRAAPDRPRHDRRGADLAAERVPLGLRGPGLPSEHEDVWVESMLTTSTATGNYPGDGVASENWPGFAAGHHRRAQHDGAAATSTSRASSTSPKAADPVDPRHGSTRSCRTPRSTTSTTSASSASFPGGRVRRSPPRRRWCRRPATCSTRYARRGRRGHRDRPRRRRAHRRTSSAPARVPPRAARGDRLRRAPPADPRSADRGDHHQLVRLNPGRAISRLHEPAATDPPRRRCTTSEICTSPDAAARSHPKNRRSPRKRREDVAAHARPPPARPCPTAAPGR